MLSQDEKRILLAKHFGWTDIHGGPPEGGAFWRGANPKHPLALKEEIPDYFNSRDAVGTCEDALSLKQKKDFTNELGEMVGASYTETIDAVYWTGAWRMVTAKAAIRAEALGQILNLW